MRPDNDASNEEDSRHGGGLKRLAAVGVDERRPGWGATLTTQVGKGWVPAAHRDWVSVQTQGTNIDATIASQLGTSSNVSATATEVDQMTNQSVGQQLAFPVTAGQTYTVTKYVGVESSQAATGYDGARYPWESALDGTEQIPPPPSVNSEGLYEQHITADVALAQWQYYLATGDKGWLAQRGSPVLSQAAAFWASRVTSDSDSSYHIDGVTGPDEENPDVNDEAYTNVAAKTTLQDAVEAAAALGVSPPATWARIASKLVVPTNAALQIHPEFSTYQGQLVKQADVTLLQHPWDYPMPASFAQADIDYYVPRTDPAGPSMSDAVNSIDTSALGTPGCASYVYTQSSVEPFIRDVFDQFSETKTGGAFTFMTGIGGFLQEFPVRLFRTSLERQRRAPRPQPDHAAQRGRASQPVVAGPAVQRRDWPPDHDRHAQQRPPASAPRRAPTSSRDGPAVAAGTGAQHTAPTRPGNHPAGEQLRTPGTRGGLTWQTVATVTGRTTGTTDVLHFAPVRARFVRLQITPATGGQPPMLEELTVTG
jgi:hypothetical protein